ncbi:MAG: hypothetical protein L0H83_03780 [Salinisphaera sp.]|nr:hypothetical protein [Salinisphaera sp.]
MPQRLREIEIGDWYATPGKSECFEVVAVDDDSRTVEVQYFDGTLEEIEFESWPQYEAEIAEAPKDWSGAFDGDDIEDQGLEMNGTGSVLDDIDALLY